MLACRYDAFDVWRNYQVGDVMPDIDADTYNKVMQQEFIIIQDYCVAMAAYIPL